MSEELAWAAGLFVGEGNVGKSKSNKGTHSYLYLKLQLGMYDERGVSRFAEAIGVSYGTLWLERRQHFFYRASAVGRSAEVALACLWPWLEGTDKGDQALRHATDLGIEDWVTGVRTDPRPQLNLRRRGSTGPRPRISEGAG